MSESASSTSAGGAATSGSGSGAPPEVRFEVKKWNAVALWVSNRSSIYSGERLRH